MCKHGLRVHFSHSSQDCESSDRREEKHGGDRRTESSTVKRVAVGLVTKYTGKSLMVLMPPLGGDARHVEDGHIYL